jgi:hypothetical protein
MLSTDLVTGFLMGLSSIFVAALLAAGQLMRKGGVADYTLRALREDSATGGTVGWRRHRVFCDVCERRSNIKD